MTRKKIRLAVLAATTALLASAASAQAGVYSVYSCKTPAGVAAPTDGWTAEQVGGAFSSPSNSCANGGSLQAQLSGDADQPVGSRLTWHYAAPANTRLANFLVWRSTSGTAAAEMNATPLEYVSWPGSGLTDAHDTCVMGGGCGSQGTHSDWSSMSNYYDAGSPSGGVTDVFFSAACGGSSGWSCVDRNSVTPMADMRIHAFWAFLEDDSDPTPAGAVSGTLTQPGAHKGIQSISFNATDTGSGIYRGIVDVRKQGAASFTTVYASVLDSNNGKCVETGYDPSTPYEFEYRVPCKLATGAQVDWDTTKVVDGIYEVRVRVEDASGNRATVYGPASFEVDNVPPPAVIDPDGAGPQTGQPTITGAARVGSGLLGDKGSWSGAGNTYVTQWVRCTSGTDVAGCTPVSGATGTQYEVVEDDLGYFLRFRVTATNDQGATTVDSAAKGPVTTAAGALPQCADSADNDGDSKIDLADPGCSNRADDSESSDAPAGGGGTGTGSSAGSGSGSSTSTTTSSTTTTAGAGGAAGAAGASGAAAPYVGPPNNGVNASNQAKITLSGTRRRTVKFGRRIATVATLRDESGHPITGAKVVVLERSVIPGSPWVAAREPLVTDAAGRMRWLIPAKASRTIRYAYKANLENTEFQSTSDVVLTVFSKTTFKSNRKFFRNGQTIRFSGRVLSRPVPRGGVLIDLQAAVGTRWQTFRTVRSHQDGTWGTGYRFHATTGLQTYRFRARVRQDTGFPYAMSRSRTFKVRVAG